MLFLRLHPLGGLSVKILWGSWLVPFGLLVIRARFLSCGLGGLLIAGSQRIARHERVTTLERAAREFSATPRTLIVGAEARGANR